VIKGFHKPLCMLQGLDDSYGAAVFVGYHSCAGTEGGVLNHTMLGKEVQNIFLNGEATGETRLNAGLAGHYGVPVALVAGDVAVCEEAKRVLPWVETVAVKDGIDKYSAVLKHPEVAAAEIRETTARALRNKAFKPYVLKPPITIGVEWNSTTIAETCGLVPGVNRMSSRSTEYTASDWPDAMKVLLVELLLALEVSGGKGIYQ
jgi:D-amino peptidase